MRGRVSALLLARRDEIRHPQPRHAIAFGLALADAATRDAILFDDVTPMPGGGSDSALAREVSAAWLAYLGVRRGRKG